MYDTRSTVIIHVQKLPDSISDYTIRIVSVGMEFMTGSESRRDDPFFSTNFLRFCTRLTPRAHAVCGKTPKWQYVKKR